MLLVRSAITYKVSRHKGVMQQNALLCYVCDFDLGRVRYAHTRNRHAQKYVSVRNGFTSVLFPFASVWQQICALLIEIRSTCTHTLTSRRKINKYINSRKCTERRSLGKVVVLGETKCVHATYVVCEEKIVEIKMLNANLFDL